MDKRFPTTFILKVNKVELNAFLFLSAVRKGPKRKGIPKKLKRRLLNIPIL